jgi:hypothetical protein
VSKIGTLRSALLELLEEHRRDGALPTSARFLFYELIARGIISKQPTGKRRADQDMSDALTDLREDGDIPWGWIADETRSLAGSKEQRKSITRSTRMGSHQEVTSGLGRRSFLPWWRSAMTVMTTCTTAKPGDRPRRKRIILDTANPDQFSRCLICGKAMKPNEEQFIRGWRSPRGGEQRFMIMHRSCRDKLATKETEETSTERIYGDCKIYCV